MKDFLLDQSGDVKLERDIGVTSGRDQTAQKLRTVLGTNREEWFLNPKEGIDFHALFVKRPDYDRIRDEIQSGVTQVDESFLLTDFSHQLTGRTLTLSFTAVNAKGEQIREEVHYADGTGISKTQL